MMRPFGMAHFCGPDGGRMGEFMIGRVERATEPTAEQRPGFDRLKEAIGKASETMRRACTTERPVTHRAARGSQKRLAAMLDAVRTVRPALDAYYSSLNDEQKARLTLAQRMGRGGGMDGGGWRMTAGATGCMTTAGRVACAARRRSGGTLHESGYRNGRLVRSDLWFWTATASRAGVGAGHTLGRGKRHRASYWR